MGRLIPRCAVSFIFEVTIIRITSNVRPVPSRETNCATCGRILISRDDRAVSLRPAGLADDPDLPLAHR